MTLTPNPKLNKEQIQVSCLRDMVAISCLVNLQLFQTTELIK